DPYPLEKLVSWCVTECAGVAEDDKLARRHLAACRRAVMFEHRAECLEQQLQVSVREASSFCELGRHIAVGPVQSIGNDMLSSHGPVVGTLVPAVGALGALLLLRLIG